MENSVQGIIDKLSEGLNFFDFSYFISGFATYCSIVYFVQEGFYKTIELVRENQENTLRKEE